MIIQKQNHHKALYLKAKTMIFYLFNYKTRDSKMKTNIDYIFACGDIIKKDVYQLTTAVGEATTAAINVKKEINS